MSSSDEHSETVPNFPPSNPPLMLRINAQTVTSALGADGKKILDCLCESVTSKFSPDHLYNDRICVVLTGSKSHLYFLSYV